MTGESNGYVEKSMIKIPKVKFTKLFINGEFIDSISGSQLFFPSLLLFSVLKNEHMKTSFSGVFDTENICNLPDNIYRYYLLIFIAVEIQQYFLFKKRCSQTRDRIRDEIFFFCSFYCFRKYLFHQYS